MRSCCVLVCVGEGGVPVGVAVATDRACLHACTHAHGDWRAPAAAAAPHGSSAMHTAQRAHHGRIARQQHGEDVALPDAARDELRVLAPVVQHQHTVGALADLHGIACAGDHGAPPLHGAALGGKKCYDMPRSNTHIHSLPGRSGNTTAAETAAVARAAAMQGSLVKGRVGAAAPQQSRVQGCATRGRSSRCPVSASTQPQPGVAAPPSLPVSRRELGLAGLLAAGGVLASPSGPALAAGGVLGLGATPMQCSSHCSTASSVHASACMRACTHIPTPHTCAGAPAAGAMVKYQPKLDKTPVRTAAALMLCAAGICGATSA